MLILLPTALSCWKFFSNTHHISNFVFQIEPKEAEVENSNEPSSGSDLVEKVEDKKELSDAVTTLKSENIKSGPSIQEPLLKAEVKEEETIHDSDFEEPSGCVYYYMNNEQSSNEVM